MRPGFETLAVGLVLVFATAPSTVSSHAREPHVSLVNVGFAGRTPSTDRIEVRAVVTSARNGDEVATTLASFSTCSAAQADRAEHHLDVIADSKAERTIVRTFSVPRAARH